MNHHQQFPDTSPASWVLWLLLSAALIAAYAWSRALPAEDEDGAL